MENTIEPTFVVFRIFAESTDILDSEVSMNKLSLQIFHTLILIDYFLTNLGQFLSM